jgi:hypothetical protein
MSAEEQRAHVVRYWWSKAEESLAAAQREFAARAYTFAVNRLYYTAIRRFMECLPHSWSVGSLSGSIQEYGLLFIANLNEI